MTSPAEREKGCDLDAVGRCELDENLEVLRREPVFSEIPVQRLRVYAYLSRRMRYRTGEFLFRQGDRDSRGYILIGGRAQVIREYKEQSLILNELKEGEFFGGLALLADVQRLFSVRAVTAVECLTVDRESFRKLIVQFPEVAIKAIDMMVKRIVQMEEKLLELKVYECLYG
jgi:CRP/FNR family cyclic AMP-dependent transcriptional regulator